MLYQFLIDYYTRIVSFGNEIYTTDESNQLSFSDLLKAKLHSLGCSSSLKIGSK